MISWLMKLLLVAGSSVLVLGQLQAQALRCDGCPFATMKDVATHAGDGRHTVVSVTSRDLRAFDVSGWGGAGRPVPVPDSVVVTEVEVDPVLKQGFDDIVAFFELHDGPAIRGTRRVDLSADDLDVPGLASASVFDLVADANLLHRVSNRLMSPASVGPSYPRELAALFEDPAQRAMGYLGMQGSLEFAISLRTLDGGRVQYRIAPGLHRAHFVDNGSQTAGGQSIPIPGRQATGTWYGKPMDELRPILDYFDQKLQARIENSCGAEPGESMTCRTDFDQPGTALHCVVAC